jgi:hypothetical protein
VLALTIIVAIVVVNAALPDITTEQIAMARINRFYDQEVCTDVSRVETIPSNLPGWNNAQYVSCKLGKYIIKANGSILPNYCGGNDTNACWNLYCVGSVYADLTKKERQHCSTLPRRILYARG